MKKLFFFFIVLAYVAAGLTVGTLIEGLATRTWQYWVILLCLASVQFLSPWAMLEE